MAIFVCLSNNLSVRCLANCQTILTLSLYLLISFSLLLSLCLCDLPVQQSVHICLSVLLYINNLLKQFTTISLILFLSRFKVFFSVLTVVVCGEAVGYVFILSADVNKYNKQGSSFIGLAIILNERPKWTHLWHIRDGYLSVTDCHSPSEGITHHTNRLMHLNTGLINRLIFIFFIIC